MKIKRPLAPEFINKLDENLLRNKPDTWSARTHLVVYYGLLFAITLFLIGFVVPNEPRNRTNIYTWVTLVSIISLIAFIIWLIYLLRFNVFKRFGMVTPGDRIKTFFLYFISIGTMVSWPFIPTITETIRANKAYSDKELINDANAINIKVLQLERDSIQLRWDKETVTVRDTLPDYNEYLDAAADAVEEVDSVVTAATNVYERRKRLIDTAQLRQRKFTTDSLQQLNDSVYVFYTCPEYQYVNPYSADGYSKVFLFTSKELYDRVLKNYRRPDVKKIQSELKPLLDKYKTQEDTMYQSSYASERYNKGLDKYDLNIVENNIEHIAYKKYRWEKRHWPQYMRIFYYTTFILALLVFIFRHTTVRTYFLTVLAGVLLSIVNGVLIALFRGEEIIVYIIGLIHFAVFLIVALWLGKQKSRSLISGIALNLTIFFVAFIPLLLTRIVYVFLEKNYVYKQTYTPFSDKYPNEQLHYLYAEIIGFIVFFFLVEFLFKQLYRKWYSQPEQ